jgi:hypothetical protein
LRREPRKRVFLKNFCVCAVYVLLFFSCAVSSPPATAQTATSSPVIGPAVEQNGVRFETWLTSPKIVIPRKSITHGKTAAAILLSVRVTNLMTTPVSFKPFRLHPTLIRPGGKELVPASILTAGYLGPAQEANYLLLQPGQSVTLPYVIRLYWEQNHMYLTWGFRFTEEYLWAYRMATGAYHFHLHYSNPSSRVEIEREIFGRPIKTSTGFRVDDVILPPLTFQLVKPLN